MIRTAKSSGMEAKCFCFSNPYLDLCENKGACARWRIFRNNECPRRNQRCTFAQKNDPLVAPRTPPAGQPQRSSVAGQEELLGVGAALPGACRRERLHSDERLLEKCTTSERCCQKRIINRPQNDNCGSARSIPLSDTFAVLFNERERRPFRKAPRHPVVFDVRPCGFLSRCIGITPLQVQIWQHR
jgi:hypothetical protein